METAGHPHPMELLALPDLLVGSHRLEVWPRWLELQGLLGLLVERVEMLGQQAHLAQVELEHPEALPGPDTVFRLRSIQVATERPAETVEPLEQETLEQQERGSTISYMEAAPFLEGLLELEPLGLVEHTAEVEAEPVEDEAQ